MRTTVILTAAFAATAFSTPVKRDVITETETTTDFDIVTDIVTVTAGEVPAAPATTAAAATSSSQNQYPHHHHHHHHHHSFSASVGTGVPTVVPSGVSTSASVIPAPSSASSSAVPVASSSTTGAPAPPSSSEAPAPSSSTEAASSVSSVVSTVKRALFNLLPLQVSEAAPLDKRAQKHTTTTRKKTTSKHKSTPAAHTTTKKNTGQAKAAVKTTSAASSKHTTITSTLHKTTTASSSTAAAAATATTYQQAVINHHNYHRTNHSADALTWSAKLANIAANIAATCVYEHNVTAGGGGYGQNIAAGVEAKDVSTVITNLFYNGEVNNFNGLYGQANPNMANFENWGHFSQIVWKGTTTVGCATQYCPNGLGNTGGDVSPYFTVCNYGPPGNYAGEYGSNIGKPVGEATIQGTYRVPANGVSGT